MNMQRPVLVAVDLGARSRVALAQAYAAAERASCGLVVVHVLSSRQLVAPLFPQWNAKHAVNGTEYRFRAFSALADLVDELPREPAIDIQLELREGDVASELLELAGHVQARLLVLSSTVRDLGPITLAVVRGAPCPVLAVAATAQTGSADAHVS